MVKTSRMMIVGALLMLIMALACNGCPTDGSQCSNCITTRMKSGCPGCVPILQCMANCLWGGSCRSDCIKKCDCADGGYPRLADCKKCMSPCKCTCLVSST